MAMDKHEPTVIAEYTREIAAHRLIAELDKGRESGERFGWLSLDEVEVSLGIKTKA